MPLPGTHVDEAERRRAWTALPRTADASTIWTPVSNCSGTSFARRSGSSRAQSGIPPFPVRCLRRYQAQTAIYQGGAPERTTSSCRNLGIDVLEVKGIVDEPYLCLNILDLGTTFQQVVLLRQGHGSPSSRECLDSYVSLWVGWAGWPQTLSCDRGIHNRGVFARTLARHGVLIRQAGVREPRTNWKS